MTESAQSRRTGGDFFVVRAQRGTWWVSLVMARSIEESLDAKPEPNWIVFVDLTGARVRVARQSLLAIEQCTAEQRRELRTLYALVDSEERTEEP